MKEMLGISIIIVCLLFAGCAEEEPIHDRDGDGVPDAEDAFPDNPEISKDSDGDGYADEYNEGYNETNSNATIDMFPDDPTEWKDSDGDGYGDNIDDFPYNKNLHALITIEEESYTIAQGGEINIYFELTDEDKSVIIYWELEGDSFTKRAGEALTMRYNEKNAWSSQYHGRTEQVTVALDDQAADNMYVKFMHEGRALSPPYTNSIYIKYTISKTR